MGGVCNNVQLAGAQGLGFRQIIQGLLFNLEQPVGDLEQFLAGIGHPDLLSLPVKQTNIVFGF